MLIKVSDHLVLNSDLIVAANWDNERSRWRLVIPGHGPDSPVIYLTESELEHIMNEVSTREMIVLMRMAGARPPRRSRPEQPNGEHR